MITLAESGLSSDDWTALSTLSGNATFGLTLYQWEAEWNTALHGGGDPSVDFATAVFGGKLWRVTSGIAAYWDAGSWHSTTYFSPTGAIGNRPTALIVGETTLTACVLTTTGISQAVWDGSSWGSWTEVVTESNIYFIAATDKLHYIVYDPTTKNYTFKAYDGSVHVSDIVWGYPILSFCAQRINGVDILAIASPLPGVLGTQVVGIQTSKYVVAAAGVCVFTYKYGTWSDHRVVDYVDQYSAWRYRDKTRLTLIGDTLWMTTYSSEGTQAAPITGYRIYSSKDGIHWSRGELVSFSQTQILGIELQQVGTTLYAVGYNDLDSAKSTLRYGSVHPDTLLDVGLHEVAALSVNRQDSQQISLTLDNADDWITGTLLDGSTTLACILRTGYDEIQIPIGVFEIDTLAPTRDLPIQGIDLQGRDRLAWMTSKSQSEQFVDWEPQVTGADDYADATATDYGGLTHTADQIGSFKTNAYRLLLASNNEQGMAFSTFITQDTWNGAIDASFELASLDNSEYGGIVFRAQDKDNYFSFRYDQVDDKLRLRQIVGGAETVLWTSGTQSWASALAVHFLRAEYRYARIRLYTSSDNTSWTLVQTVYTDGQASVSNPMIQSGFVGVIGLGFSDIDTTQISDGIIPAPGIILNPITPYTPTEPPVEEPTPVPPTAAFSMDNHDPTIYFTDESTVGSGGDIVAWYWEFGDGATSNVKNPTHYYGVLAGYTINLTVTDANGLTDSVSHTITIGSFSHVFDLTAGSGNWMAFFSSTAYVSSTGWKGTKLSHVYSYGIRHLFSPSGIAPWFSRAITSVEVTYTLTGRNKGTWGWTLFIDPGPDTNGTGERYYITHHDAVMSGDTVTYNFTDPYPFSNMDIYIEFDPSIADFELVFTSVTINGKGADPFV